MVNKRKMKVKIKDYQAIKNAELEFNPGITAIVGNSNNGKSSLIRAIEAAINNKGGSGFINYDSDQAEVTIEDSGNVISWIKNQKSTKSYYDINGTILNKIGQTQVPEVAELLNMKEIEVGNDRFRLNFWKQMEYPFLVGKTSYQLFDFISKSDEQEIISSLQSSSSDDLKDNTKEINTKSTQVDVKISDIAELEKDLEGLTKFKEFDLDELEELISVTTAIKNKVESYEENTSTIVDYIESVGNYNSKIGELSKVMKSIEAGKLLYDKLSSTISIYESNEEKSKFSEKILIESKSLIKSKKDKIKRLKDIIDETNETEKAKLGLESLVEKLLKNLEQKKTTENYITILQGKVEETKKKLSEFDVCPLCGCSLESCEVNHEQ